MPTLAALLSEHGFETAAFVNAIFMGGTFGLARGFDVYDFVPADDSAAGAARRVSERGLAWLEAK